MAYWLGFWVFTVMTQVQSLVGELRYHEPKKKRGGEKRTFHSFLSIMYTVQTNRGKVIFHAKNNLRSPEYFKSGKTHLKQLRGKKKTHKYIKMFNLKVNSNREGLPWYPMVKNVPCRAGHTGLIPGLGTKIPRPAEQLGPHTTTTEPVCSRALHTTARKQPTSHSKRSCTMQGRSHSLQLRPAVAK